MNNEEIIRTIVEINGYEKLNPPQQESTKYISSNNNVIVSSPTASGKTTIFEMYLLDQILNKQKKVVYISPLKALTSEHYKETKRKFSKKFNIKVGISTGDLDSSSKNLKNYDALFLTYEKFDSILRHEPSWLEDIGLITIDEIHELGSDRGSTLEIIITQIRKNYVNTRFLGLSATIGNSEEISQWLNASLIKSDYRPIPLEIGIFYKNKLFLENNNIVEIDYSSKNNIKDNGLSNIIIDTLEKNKQIIVFCNSRKNTMSFAWKYSNIVNKYISNKEKNMLVKKSQNIASVLEQPTKQCLLLYNTVKKGVAFHHAGLLSKQRTLIEDNFKNKYIKVIFATPTLAAGINLPAYRVVINTIYRFTNEGMQPIPVNEFHQMTGRAGRPKYDDCGQAIAIVNKEKDIAKIYNSYVIAQPTNVESQLSKIPLLRVHLLSIILNNNIKNLEEINDFISKTFYYYSFGNNQEIKNTVNEISNDFFEYGFLKGDNSNFKITALGSKVCLLYLDPISAHNIIEDINIKKNKKIEDFERLFTICNTSELHPYMRYNSKREEELFDIFENIKDKIYFDYEDINLLKKINLCDLLNDWINEVKENNIIDKYKTSPGQIQNIVNRTLWIIHCILEISKFTKIDLQEYKKYKDLQKRIKYGIKEDLLSLVELKNIGRIRARKLANNNIRSIKDIKKDPDKFIGILGKVGENVLKELNIKFTSNTSNTKKDLENNQKRKIIKTQKNIFDY
jgi:helicase